MKTIKACSIVLVLAFLCIGCEGSPATRGAWLHLEIAPPAPCPGEVVTLTLKKAPAFTTFRVYQSTAAQSQLLGEMGSEWFTEPKLTFKYQPMSQDPQRVVIHWPSGYMTQALTRCDAQIIHQTSIVR